MKETVDTTTRLAAAAPDAAECRRLARELNLDAVGIVRNDGGRRRVSWWAAPEVGVRPAEVSQILEGRAPEWISCPRGEDVVFAHLTPGSSVHSVATLSALLGGRPDEVDGPAPQDLGGVAPEDPVARERTRLAYAIHDGLTQVVTAAVLELEWLARRAELEPQEMSEALTSTAIEMRKALEEIRGMLASLSPEEPRGAQRLDELVQGVMERWQLPATWSVEGDLQAVPRPVLEAASSVIRESVANAAKHSASREVAVRVHATRSNVEVRVEDRGRGFRPAGTGLHAGHLGLEMMRRRVAEVHGTLDIESSPGQGTRVVARLPVLTQGEKP
jgi:signal transduction histidine kinase